MKKDKVTFIPLDGTGALHIDFQLGPFGEALEAKRGNGIGFFSQSGEIQGVTFDDVKETKDRQALEFDRYLVEVSVDNGKVSHSMTSLNAPSKKSSKKTSQDAA